MTAAGTTLRGQLRSGLAWGAINSLVLRAGSVVVSVILARLLLPADFGVYAVALTVQAILVTLVDLGFSTDLVRAETPERRAPTVATLSLVTSGLLATVMILTALPVSRAMGSTDAAPVIRVLALTLLLSGAGVVPYALLQRRFHQKQMFMVSLVDFVVGTITTLVFVLLGLGPMALALSRLLAQSVSTILQFTLTHERPRFGFDRRVAASALAIGLPLAGANMLSWALVNFDNVVIARLSGAVSLGFYVLAFNISSWPMSVVAQSVRGVSLAGFSRVAKGERDRSLAQAFGPVWAAALAPGFLLALLATPLITLLYGPKWVAAAPALAALGTFGAVRVALDLMATYLIARGKSRSVLCVQVVWAAALVPAIVVGTRYWGVAGAGWGHVVASLLVALPAYLVALRSAGADVPALLHAAWPPCLTVLPAGFVAALLASASDVPVLALSMGGLGGVAPYALILLPWARSRLSQAGMGRGGIRTEDGVSKNETTAAPTVQRRAPGRPERVL